MSGGSPASSSVGAPHVVLDRRPSSELSDEEVVAYLFQAARVEAMTTVAQLRAACDRMFPDLPDQRQHDCLVALGTRLRPPGPWKGPRSGT